MIAQMRLQAVLTRRVDVTSPTTVVVYPESHAFLCAVTDPRQGRVRDDSPRALPAYTIRWATNPLMGPAVEPTAGSRVTVAGVEYELLEDAREMRQGYRVVAKEAQCQRVDVLYPLTGAITAQEGTVLVPVAQYAAYNDSENQNDRARYDDMSAQAPVQHWENLRGQNVSIGGMMIVRASIVPGAPRVDMTVRVPRPA